MVNSQTVSIIGGGLTQNETTTLQIRAAEELPVQLGGEYHFVYMAADSTNGELNMYKSPNDVPTTGVFQKQEKYPEGTIVELNGADTTTLKKIPGIGSSFARRITKYRELLGGFHHIEQLAEVYGIDEERYSRSRSTSRTYRSAVCRKPSYTRLLMKS